MIDLIYPLSKKMTTLPQASLAGSKPRKTEKGVEYFPVINDEWVGVARAERNYCHSGGMVLHPGGHIHMIDRRERV